LRERERERGRERGRERERESVCVCVCASHLGALDRSLAWLDRKDDEDD
jgi:hypothetical protein